MHTVHGRDVVRALFDGLEGRVELRALPSRQRTFCRADDVAEMQRFAGAASPGDGVYFGVATRRDGTSGRLDDCLQLGALFADLDCKDRPLDDARAIVDALPVRPSILIGSGGGLHGYWLLREPIDVQADPPALTALLRRLAHATTGDLAAAEPARVLRLPGTLNHKYDPPRKVTIEMFDPDHRVNVSDVDDWLPELPAEFGATHDAAPLSLEAPIASGERNQTLYRLARTLRARALPHAVILDTLLAVNHSRCQPPLSPAEVGAVAAHAVTQPDRDGHERPDGDHSDTARELRVIDAVERERARREARRRLNAEERAQMAPPVLETLRTRLARPADVTSWRVEGWQPRNSRVILAAQFKAGKTTLRDNYLRSLVDGTPWLGQSTVHPVFGTVALLDTEMSSGQLDSWLRDQRIQGDDRIIVTSLRGHAAAFNILDRDVRADWAERLRAHGVQFLCLDCLRPVLDALGLDEHNEAGRFLVAFDALLQDADIPEALVVHHMGHAGERSRGDSRLRDWPDVEWRLVRQDDDPAAVRYISAYGRDVDIPESQLQYDPATRALTIAGGSRRDTKAREALDDVLVQLDAAPDVGLSQRAIEGALRSAGCPHSRELVRGAVALGIRAGLIQTDPGPHRATLHRRAAPLLSDPSAPVRGSAPTVRRNSTAQCAAPLRERALAHSPDDHSSAPGTDPAFMFDPRGAFDAPREAQG